MASSVTIPGSNQKPITLSFDTASNFAIAQQIAVHLGAAIDAGTLTTASDTLGPLPVLPPDAAGALIQTSELATLGQGYNTDLVIKPGSALVFGSGATNQTILSDAATSLTFIATAGSGIVVAGGGNNRLFVSAGDTANAVQANIIAAGDNPNPDGSDPGGNAGNWSLYTGGGNDIISALGVVNATIGAGGGHNAILLGSGQDMVISSGDDFVSGGSAQATIDATGAHSDFVQGMNSKLLFVGGSGSVTMLGGTGSDTYLGSNAGPGGNQLIKGGSAGNNFLFAGDGLATLVGGGKNDQLFSYGSSNQWLVAGSGNETLSAALSAGNDTLTAGSGSNALIGGFGADTFVGGSGHATVTAGPANDVFAFINHQAGGTELVQGVFDPASIEIRLLNYGPRAIDQALASQTVKNGSVTIGLSDGTKVTFQDVTSLQRSNFT